MAEMSGIFEAAVNRSGELQDWVTNLQEDARDRADAMREKAVEGIEAMGDFLPALTPTVNMPTAPVLQTNLDIDLQLPALTTASFGEVQPIDRGDFNVSPIAPVPDLDIVDFELNQQQVTIPDAPEPLDHGEIPEKPVLGTITLPTKPVLVKPLMPGMVEVHIPEFQFPVLPLFDATAPEWVDTPISTVLQWTEKPHDIVILDEAVEKLRAMWSGGLGLPAPVEQALWERAASREDIGVARDIAQAATEFSSRGYSLPPGAMAGRLDSIRSEALLRKQSLGRDILIKVADTQIENLRFACSQALAAEQVYISIWQSMAQREFEAAKIQLDSQLALLNARIAIFNAKQSAYATEATVFRAKLEAALATIQVFRAQVDAEIAKGQLNEQRVRVYSEQVKALLADIEIFKTEMEGAQLESNVQRNLIEVFKSEVQAFAEVVQADKTRFDAYESRVKGEAAKAGMIESQARGYAAYVSGKSARSEVYLNNQRTQIAISDQRLRAHIANLEKDRNMVQAQVAVVQANAEAHRANTARFTASAGAETAKAELQVRTTEAGMRLALSQYEIEIRRYMNDMQQMIQAAGLQLEALKAAGQATATMAAGAMAGLSVGASVSASSGISASGAENISQSI